MALLHFVIGLFAASFAIILLDWRWAVDLCCLLAISAATTAWSLLLDRRWVYLSLFVMSASFATFALNLHVFEPRELQEPYHPTGTDWYRGIDKIGDALVCLWALGIGILAIIGIVATSIHLVHLSVNKDQTRPFRSRPALLALEIVIGLVCILVVYVLDFHRPLAANEKMQMRISKHKQIELAAQREVELKHQQLFQAISDLTIAVAAGDNLAASTAAEAIGQYKTGSFAENRLWEKELRRLGEKDQLFLIEEMIAGRWSNRLLVLTLEKHAETPNLRSRIVVARRRLTIASIHEKSSIYDDKYLGSLIGDSMLETIPNQSSYFVRLVQLLIDAIGDSQHTTPQERIDLAKAIERAAELHGYDMKPAIGVLRAIIDGDDLDSVRQAAASALAKVEADRE